MQVSSCELRALMLHALLQVLPSKTSTHLCFLVKENRQFYFHSVVEQSKFRWLSKVVVYECVYQLKTKLAVHVKDKGSQPVFKSGEKCVLIYSIFAVEPRTLQFHLTIKGSFQKTANLAFCLQSAIEISKSQ